MLTNKYQTLKSYGNKILRAGASLTSVGLAALVMGCGTINSGRYQVIRVESEPAGAEIWVWENDNKRYEGITPAEIPVSRKSATAITIKKESYIEKYQDLDQEFNKESFKNFYLLPFFFIGGAVDLISGGTYNLTPKSISVSLKEKPKVVPEPIPKKELNIKKDEETVKYLKMLKELKDNQTITEEEFKTKRKTLIDKL